MTVLRSLPILPLLLLTACGSGEEQNASAPPANQAGEAAFKAQPVKEEHRSLTLTPQWLSGRWQTEEGDNCAAGDTFFTFNPDGGYTFMGEAGRWSLQGSSLTIEVTEPSAESGAQAGEKHTTQVVPISPNEAEFRTDGQAPSRVYRCHEG